MILLNLYFEGGRAKTVFTDGRRKTTVTDSYHPYFYASCDDLEEKRYLFSQHPLIIGATVENGAVRIATEMKDFRRVAGDIREVGGVTELFETTVPHHFRYGNLRGLRYFADYAETADPALLRPAGEPDMDEAMKVLRLGVITEQGMTDADGNAAPAGSLDVVFSYGGDRSLRGMSGMLAGPLGCFMREAVHIDVQSDMAHDIYDEPSAGDILARGRERLIRIMELSAMTMTKPDLIARVTPGKLNTYLHMAAAMENGILIPDRRKWVERPKSIRLLRIMDKGGTIFYPRPGIYGDVAKCDFASMYPNIIIRYNISPERMHCECGDDRIVPEAGWRICRRKGLIPQGLEKVLERRLELKRLMRAETDPGRRHIYSIRQRALKNILVTCFGYLGYSNFIFSNVECKECVMLYGRHVLERTKAIAEEEGLEVVYGIVDSVFVRGGTMESYRRFAGRVSREMGFELELDCVFRKIAFPSAADGSGAANKYYGITHDGKIEARGIGMRHSDAPAFIREFQERAIRMLLGDRGQKSARELVREYECLLAGQKIPLEKLAITKSIRRQKYATRQAHAIAYEQSAEKGGQVTFVFTTDGPKPVELATGKTPDHKMYIRLLGQAMDELVIGLDGF
ncbi:MAG: DNA polymerase domain-containing protein [Candidatus Micrarchaeia archaeon]